MARMRCGKCDKRFGESANVCPHCGAPVNTLYGTFRRLLLIVVSSLVVFAFAAGTAWYMRLPKKRTFQDLLKMQPAAVAKMDIAEMNLLCASGLPGAESMDVAECLKELDKVATWVKHETDRHLYRFYKAPQDYRNSEGYFRVYLLTQVLGEDLLMRYNMDLVKSGIMRDITTTRFYRNSGDIFIHGLISDKRIGSCSSMPVMVVAVGRRLGYPMKLVPSKGHLFCRWESPDDKGRFNIETQGEGFDSYPDHHYREWPYPITEEEIKRGLYLTSLTPLQELSAFMELRGMCLLENHRYSEAIVALERAIQLWPTTPNTQYMLSRIRVLESSRCFATTTNW